MENGDEKEYRLRIKEREKALIIKLVAEDLKQRLQQFMADNEKLIRAYNKGAYQWQQRADIRKKILGSSGTIIAELEQEYLFLQKLVWKGRGRPYRMMLDPIDEWFQQKVTEDCNKALHVG